MTSMISNLVKRRIYAALRAYDIYRKKNIQYRKEKKGQGESRFQCHGASFSGGDERCPL